MFCSVSSAAIYGVEAVEVRVEADVSDGMPQFVMVGSASAQTREGQDRVRTALRSMGTSLPPKRITINLVPADIRKEGTRFDLPIAAAVLQAMGRIARGALAGTLLVGEVCLNGRIQGIRGVLPTVCMAKERGYRRCIVPSDNIIEGKIVEGICVEGVDSLQDLLRLCEGQKEAEPCGAKQAAEEAWYEEDFGDIRGQEYVKRAALIAACGFHNMLLGGSPGSGKTMIAKRIPTILPKLEREESLELSKIYSVAGMLDREHPLITKRPFREPHYTVSIPALLGGGHVPVPGEITLAHQGVLFLDELPEMPGRVAEVLRQPLEERRVVISRLEGRFVFPANFMLVAAMNLCPCGYYPDLNRCSCTPQEIGRYLRRISQPLLDRMDVYVEVPELNYEALAYPKGEGETSAQMRETVQRVYELQKERFAGTGSEAAKRAGEAYDRSAGHAAGLPGEDRRTGTEQGGWETKEAWIGENRRTGYGYRAEQCGRENAEEREAEQSAEACRDGACRKIQGELIRESAAAAARTGPEAPANAGMPRFNSGISARDVARYCVMTAEAERVMRASFQSLGISARGYHRILKVARTIADIDGADVISEAHISEAICLRGMERNAWKKI